MDASVWWCSRLNQATTKRDCSSRNLLGHPVVSREGMPSSERKIFCALPDGGFAFLCVGASAGRDVTSSFPLGKQDFHTAQLYCKKTLDWSKERLRAHR